MDIDKQHCSTTLFFFLIYLSIKTKVGYRFGMGTGSKGGKGLISLLWTGGRSWLQNYLILSSIFSCFCSCMWCFFRSCAHPSCVALFLHSLVFSRVWSWIRSCFAVIVGSRDRTCVEPRKKKQARPISNTSPKGCTKSPGVIFYPYNLQ